MHLAPAHHSRQIARPEIEGMRFFAIVPIFLFHLSPGLLPSGFIGVDIFFVISGYLITGLILRDQSNFSIRAFLTRRFFRLFPSLLVTVIGTLAISWFVLSPMDFAGTSWAAIFSLLGVSNFYFFSRLDYFNPAGLDQPLLHAWSLAVEEQFYLVWPLLLIAMARWRASLLTTCSLVFALSFLSIFPAQNESVNLTFFIMPFRMFEFAIGAAVLAIESRISDKADYRQFLAGFTGLALLAVSFSRIDSETVWPGYWTLPAAIGTALLIAGASHHVWQRFLSLAPFRFIGRISYSIYLVHWPVITLYNYFSVVEPGLLMLLALAAVILAEACILHFLVEKPFRISATYPISDAGFASRLQRSLAALPLKTKRRTIAAATLACLIGCIFVIAARGFPERFDKGNVQFLDNGLTYAGDLCDARRSVCVFGDRASSRVIYLVGDSHALNLVYGLDELFRSEHIRGITLSDHGCLFAYKTTRFIKGVLDRKCGRNVASAYAILAENKRPVIFAGDYAGYLNTMGLEGASGALRQSEAEYYAWLGQQLRASLSQIGAQGRPIALVKQSYDLGLNLGRCLQQNASDDAKCVTPTLAQASADYALADKMIDDLKIEFPALVILDPKREFCATKPCKVKNGGDLYFRDSAHLTNSGSSFLVNKFEPKLSPLLQH